MKTILSYCDNNQVISILAYIISQLKTKDWTTDPYITQLQLRLETKYEEISESMGEVKVNPFTEKILTKDQLFDKSWLCLKAFAKANTYVADEQIVENAKALLLLIEAHNSDLYRMPYAKEIEAANAFLHDLEQEEWLSKMNNLLGIELCVQQVRKALNELKIIYFESITDKANQEKIEAPYLQKKEIREIINSQLLIYLNAMCMVQPDIYSEINNNITTYIDLMNQKAKTENKKKQDESIKID